MGDGPIEDLMGRIACEWASKIRDHLDGSFRVAVVLMHPESRTVTLATDCKTLGTADALREAARSLEEAIGDGEADDAR